LLFTDDISVRLQDYETPLPGGDYRIKVKEMGFSSAKKTAFVDSIYLLPNAGKYEFGLAKGHEVDRMDLAGKRLAFNGLDFPALLFDNRVRASSLYGEGIDLEVFRDKNLPDPEQVFKPMPQASLSRLQWVVDIDSISIIDASIAYEEHAEDALEAGRVELQALNIYGYDFCTDSARIFEENLVTRLYLYTYIMGTGLLTAEFNIPIGAENSVHTFRGTLDKMSLSDINPLLQNVAFVRIKSGTAKRIDFDIVANAEYAEGKMRFHYNNLEVSLLDRKTNKVGIEQRIISFVANTFLVNSDNPKFLFVKRGKIYYERDEYKSIFNYWANTLLRGVISSIGINRSTKPTKKAGEEEVE
jgi:hypothetical protein